MIHYKDTGKYTYFKTSLDINNTHAWSSETQNFMTITFSENF